MNKTKKQVVSASLKYEPAPIPKASNKQLTKKREKIMDDKSKIKAEKTSRKKLNLETFKTVLIAILITGIIAFIAGIKYEQQAQAEIQAKVQESVTMLKQNQ